MHERHNVTKIPASALSVLVQCVSSQPLTEWFRRAPPFVYVCKVKAIKFKYKIFASFYSFFPFDCIVCSLNRIGNKNAYSTLKIYCRLFIPLPHCCRHIVFSFFFVLRLFHRVKRHHGWNTPLTCNLCMLYILYMCVVL